MNDNVIKKTSHMIASRDENDCLSEAFIYENALKNLQREIEEKQKLITKLQIKASPVQNENLPLINQSAYDEYEYLKNKNAMQRIKEDAADILLGELKSITSNLKKKLNDIDEKEKRISSRLIELEERQAILEEIDYVQRMIPKRIINESINKSVQTKQELDIDIENMFRPATELIAEKTSNKLDQNKYQIISEKPKDDIKPLLKNKQAMPKADIEQYDISDEPGSGLQSASVKEAGDEQEFIPPVIEQKQEIKKADIIVERRINDLDSKTVLKAAAQAKTGLNNDLPANKSDKSPVAKSDINIVKRQAVKPEPAESKKDTANENKINEIKLSKTNTASASTPLARDAKSKKSYTSKPERKGLYHRERSWKNFAYIKDSKIKLKQDDLIKIQKTIMDIERGKLSMKGM